MSSSHSRSLVRGLTFPGAESGIAQGLERVISGWQSVARRRVGRWYWER